MKDCARVIVLAATLRASFTILLFLPARRPVISIARPVVTIPRHSILLFTKHTFSFYNRNLLHIFHLVFIIVIIHSNGTMCLRWPQFLNSAFADNGHGLLYETFFAIVSRKSRSKRTNTNFVVTLSINRLLRCRCRPTHSPKTNPCSFHPCHRRRCAHCLQSNFCQCGCHVFLLKYQHLHFIVHTISGGRGTCIHILSTLLERSLTVLFPQEESFVSRFEKTDSPCRLYQDHFFFQYWKQVCHRFLLNVQARRMCRRWLDVSLQYADNL